MEKLLGMVGELKEKQGEVVDTQATYPQIASSSPIPIPNPLFYLALGLFAVGLFAVGKISTELLDVTSRLKCRIQTLSNVVSCQDRVMNKLNLSSIVLERTVVKY